jgi:hypothetical protein
MARLESTVAPSAAAARQRTARRRGPAAVPTSCATPSAPPSPTPDVPIDVIRQLAGHADIRTTTVYTDVADTRLQDGIDAAARRRRGLGRLA